MLLEAILALLIISMVATASLECIRMMRASVDRFRITQEVTRARMNGMAIARHLVRMKVLKDGQISYGSFDVNWTIRPARTFNVPVMTAAGVPQTRRLIQYEIVVRTSRQGRQVDEFRLQSAGSG